jgi:hypothetical protein
MPSIYGPGFGTVYPVNLVLDRAIAGVPPVNLVYTGEGYKTIDFEHRLRPVMRRMVQNALEQSPLKSVRDRLSLRLFELPIDSQTRGKTTCRNTPILVCAQAIPGFQTLWLTRLSRTR